MRAVATKQSKAPSEKSSPLIRANAGNFSAIGARRAALNLQRRGGNEARAGYANNSGPAADYRDGFKTACAHDFSRASVFSKQELDGRTLPPHHGVVLPRREHEQIGIGRTAAAPAVGPSAADAKATDSTAAAHEAESASDAFTINSKTVAHAPDGTPDNRMTVGVCEGVEFTIGKGIQSADWEAHSGWYAAGKEQATFKWFAPERPGVSKITARIPLFQQTYTRYMNVVAPNAMGMRKLYDLSGDYPAFSAGAGMRLEWRVYPLNVSFSRIQTREDKGGASNITGYFSAFNEKNLEHSPFEGWLHVLEDNKVVWGDTAATKPGTLPMPWKEGSFQWVIPNRYRCNGSSGDGYIFTDTLQSFHINAKGTVTVSKETEIVRRSP
ncbi:MAG: hypothetical protein M3362_12135 [Acidobacteriota bacterium]|nr:hypothetical protein [Acidobacteriota bacterium]